MSGKRLRGEDEPYQRKKRPGVKKTTEQFVKEAQANHKNEDGSPIYDYSKSIYINAITHIIVICSIHGEFQVLPYHHLEQRSGNTPRGGCRKCSFISFGKKQRTSQEEFIKRANEVHHGKYRYDKTVYIVSTKKVMIYCLKHQYFEQLPSDHLQGHGCPKCGKESMAQFFMKSQEDFIKEAIAVHHGKYRYDKTVYTNSKQKIIIFCIVHQKYFEQQANAHLQGTECPLCGTESMANQSRKSVEDFIAQATVIHHGKYDYSNVQYINCETKVPIKCPKHGEFEQTPHSHLSGQGCSLCGKESMANQSRKSVEEFIAQATRIHHGKYRYHNVQYVNVETKVPIECPKHGEFKQRPHAHLAGQGCPTCKQSRMEREMLALLENVRDMQRRSSNAEWQIENIIYNQCIFPRSRLKTDFFVCLVDSAQQRYSVVIEMHGDQHFGFNLHFHRTEERFRASQERDRRKIELCKEKGYPMLFFDSGVPKKYYDCIVRTFFDVTVCGSVENACFGNWFRPGSFPL